MREVIIENQIEMQNSELKISKKRYLIGLIIAITNKWIEDMVVNTIVVHTKKPSQKTCIINNLYYYVL